MKIYLVLLETSGNQDFLFRTNMLRDNVGASELTYRAGTQFVLDAVAKATGKPSLWNGDPRALRTALLDPQQNAPIDNAEVEVVIATSGKAIVLARTKDLAQRIVRYATETALKEAPGIDLAGCHAEVDIADMDDPNQLDHFAAAVKQTYETFGRVQAVRTSTKSRFPMLPIVAPCQASGYPASRREQLSPTERVDLSHVSGAKWAFRRNWLARLKKSCPQIEFPGFKDLEDKLKGQTWISVVHADGNGIGRIFLQFHSYLSQPSCRRYIDSLRQFSIQLEEATEAAVETAVTGTWGKDALIAPLILGGDDLTAVCEGTRAIAFARKYLEAFEAETANPQRTVLHEISANANNGRAGLKACAGVAVVKPHFPFHAAYELAEDLLREAKKAKCHDCSALDFHILFDSVFSDLERVRDRLRVDGARLTARPYVVGTIPGNSPWAQQRRIADLDEMVEALTEHEEDRPAIPRSQIHDIKEALFLGRQAADTRMRLIRKRYVDTRFDRLLEDTTEPGSLFRRVVGEKHEYETRFLDAIDLSAISGAEEA
jgi:hypothetical protein